MVAHEHDGWPDWRPFPEEAPVEIMAISEFQLIIVNERASSRRSSVPQSHSLQFMPAHAEPEQHGLSAELSDARSVIQMLACTLEQDAFDVAHPVPCSKP
jgi:hypothetical protein